MLPGVGIPTDTAPSAVDNFEYSVAGALFAQGVSCIGISTPWTVMDALILKPSSYYRPHTTRLGGPSKNPEYISHAARQKLRENGSRRE